MKKKRAGSAETNSTKNTPAKASRAPISPAKNTSAKNRSAVNAPSFKAFVLFFISLIMVFIFFGFKRNKTMLNEKIINYWNDFQEQKDKAGDIEQRKTERYGDDYTFAKTVTDFFQKRGVDSKVLLLVPASKYFKERGIDVHVVEPSVFYYFTGLKTVWAHSPKAVNANWILLANKGRLIFDTVTSKEMLMQKIDSFKKYPIAL